MHHRKRPRTERITLTLTLACALALLAGCAPRPMYQHKHLDGATARGAFRADDRYCEDQLPHVLPSAIYVSTSGLYIYESQSGRAQGYSKQSAVAGARAPLMARQTGNKPLTTTKTDESAGRYLYDECMAARGWIVRDDAETGETAEGAASRAPR